MLYVMSDIHGEYERYLSMLEQIDFSQDDTLFVLGDVVDRGPEPIRVLQDMASRDNVYLLKGNHEAMASFVLRRLNVEITEDNAESHVDMESLQAIMEWQQKSQYTYEELACMRPDFERQYYKDSSIYIVSGHTPTLAVTGKSEIYHSHNNILIDCGAAFGGRLACLCLDTMTEFYV